MELNPAERISPARASQNSANHYRRADRRHEGHAGRDFRPILPVKSYKAVDDAIGYVNDHERPLGLYYFGEDSAEETRVVNSTTSGGVSVNDVLTISCRTMRHLVVSARRGWALITGMKAS